MKITRKQLLSLIQEAVDADGDGELSSRELRQLADELEKDGAVDPVDELIAYIQTVTPEDEIGISEVENMLYSQGHSAEKIDSILEDPRLDQYYDALEDIFAPTRVQKENKMKITRSKLSQIIREELGRLNENSMSNSIVKSVKSRIDAGQLTASEAVEQYPLLVFLPSHVWESMTGERDTSSWGDKGEIQGTLVAKLESMGVPVAQDAFTYYTGASISSGDPQYLTLPNPNPVEAFKFAIEMDVSAATRRQVQKLGGDQTYHGANFIPRYINRQGDIISADIYSKTVDAVLETGAKRGISLRREIVAGNLGANFDTRVLKGVYTDMTDKERIYITVFTR